MHRILTLSIFASVTMVAVISCFDSSSGSAATNAEVIETYASGVHASYSKSLASAQAMDQAVTAFLREPNPSTLESAKRACCGPETTTDRRRRSGSTAGR